MLQFTKPDNSRQLKSRKPVREHAMQYSGFMRAVGFGDFMIVDQLDPYHNYNEEMTDADYTSHRRSNALMWRSNLTTIRMAHRGLLCGDKVCFDYMDQDDVASWPVITLSYHHSIILSAPIVDRKTLVMFTVFRKM